MLADVTSDKQDGSCVNHDHLLIKEIITCMWRSEGRERGDRYIGEGRHEQGWGKLICQANTEHSSLVVMYHLYMYILYILFMMYALF